MSDESQKLLNILLGGKDMPIGEDVLNALAKRYSIPNEINHEILKYLLTYDLPFHKEVVNAVEKIVKMLKNLESKLTALMAK